MSDNVVGLHGAEPKQNTIWEAAIAVALKMDPVYGMLIYVNGEGETCYLSIGSDHPTMRGLIEEIRDDLRGF